MLFAGVSTAKDLKRDTEFQYCPSQLVLIKGGTSATLRNNQLVSGVLARETGLSIKPSFIVLFKAGTRVTFRGPPLCRVRQGTLAKDTGLPHTGPHSTTLAPYKAGTTVTFNTKGQATNPRPPAPFR
jgi:hypothetical protein